MMPIAAVNTAILRGSAARFGIAARKNTRANGLELKCLSRGRGISSEW